MLFIYYGCCSRRLRTINELLMMMMITVSRLVPSMCCSEDRRNQNQWHHRLVTRADISPGAQKCHGPQACLILPRNAMHPRY